jgi:hypothetical protein
VLCTVVHCCLKTGRPVLRSAGMKVQCFGDVQRNSSRSCIGGTTATARQSRLQLLLPGVCRPPQPTQRSRACHRPARQNSPVVAQGQYITTMQRLAAAQSWRWHLRTGAGCNEEMRCKAKPAVMSMLGCTVPLACGGATQLRWRGWSIETVLQCVQCPAASRGW